jgi:purine-binding chemotaxis protein CheW
MSQKKEGKYLIFGMNGQVYGLPIQDVREINRMTDVTPVPQTEDYVSGVMNLRGKVIPVVDLRTRLGMARAEATKHTCILVVEGNKSGTGLVGVIVDSVSCVMDFVEAQIDSAESSIGGKNPLLIGMGRTENQVIILLDVARAILDADLSAKIDLPSVAA